jgi:hypothetical protein
VPLTSKLFRGDQKLEACLISDPAHVTPGAAGEHVGKIQFALTVMGLGVINAEEISAQRYGPSTAQAVLGYKRARKIINTAYQTTADNIVGKMTIAQLDKEMADFERRNPPPPPPKPDPKPPSPPKPTEPVSTGFAVRAAGHLRGPLAMEEPPDGDPTTVSAPFPPDCFQVFDLDNMPRVQLDGQHAAIYLFHAPGVLPAHVQPQHFKRLPRIFRVRTAVPLSALSCRCTYRTIAHNNGKRESFLDLRLPDRTVSVPMFIHLMAQPLGKVPFVTVSQEGEFRFSKLGL